MVKLKNWRITQWIVAITALGYIALISLSPWYYSMTYTQNYEEDIIQTERESLPSREIVDPFHTDRYGNNYNAKGEQINEYGDILDGAGQWMPDPSLMSEPTIEVENEGGMDSIAGELPREAPQQLTLREKMILDKESNIEPEDGEEDLQRNYKNQGKFNWIDYIFIGGVLLTLTYGYGLFLSSAGTLVKLLITPTVLLILKTVYIYKAVEIYRLNLTNVLNWWLGFVVVIVTLVINHINVMFVCKEVGGK